MDLVRSLIGRLALVLTAAGAVARAGIAPENVAVVVNADSAASRTIAAEYVKLRGIPDCNLIHLSGLTDREPMGVDDFRRQILAPVLRTITDRGLAAQIDVIAYSSEIPTAIDVRADIGDRRLPEILTPVAAINGLTFLHELVMAKDIRYLDLGANAYARRLEREDADPPWTAEEQRRYAELMRAIDEHLREAKSAPAGSAEAATVALRRKVVEGFATLRESHPRSAHLHYNRACCLARLGSAADAIAALDEAVACGWFHHRYAAGDPDLQSLVQRDDFKALLDKMRSLPVVVRPAHGFRAAAGWRPDGSVADATDAPRYLLSIVLACTTGRGTSVEEAVAGLRRAAAADGTRPGGTIYFERNRDVRSTTREWAFDAAVHELEKLGVKGVVEDGILPRGRKDVAGAVIGIASFDWHKSDSTILPGAIVEHLTSLGGVLSTTRKNAGQTPLTAFLRAGAAGASGTVTEPYALQAKFPSPFIHVHYASGCTLVESFYLSLAGPYQLLIIGDPLARPWRRDFTVAVANLTSGAVVTGDVELDVRTASSDGITAARHELYVDGRLVASCPSAAPLRWSSRGHADGEHDLTVIARGADAIQSVARLPLRVTVRGGR
ncbi:MAG: TPR end-of-group domain-containing protein [Planctomycetia bacterium]